jgi:hypothetical protein
MGRTDRAFDSLLQLKDAGAITSSAAAQVDGSAKVLDTGDDKRYTGQVIIDVSAVKITANDEIYTIVLQGSPDSAFTAATSVELCQINLSAAEEKLTDTNRDDTTGRYLLPFTNEFAGTFYRYLRLYTVIAGTSPSINYSAYAAQH